MLRTRTMPKTAPRSGKGSQEGARSLKERIREPGAPLRKTIMDHKSANWPTRLDRSADLDGPAAPDAMAPSGPDEARPVDQQVNVAAANGSSTPGPVTPALTPPGVATPEALLAPLEERVCKLEAGF